MTGPDCWLVFKEEDGAEDVGTKYGFLSLFKGCGRRTIH